MNEIVPTSIVLLIGTAIVAAWARRFEPKERSWVLAAYAAHVIAAFAQVWITMGYYGGGDLLYYSWSGREVARLLRHDFGYAVDVVAIMFHQDQTIPIAGLTGDNTTRTVSALSGFIFFISGDSLYSACLIVSIASFYGQLAIYRVFRDRTPKTVHLRLAIGIMLLPTVVYWTAGILKEAVAMAGFGWVVFGWHLYLRGRRASGLTIALLGAVPVGLVKAYILFGFLGPAFAWWYWERASDGGRRAPKIKPTYIVIAAGLGVVGLVLLGELFPRFKLDSVVDETQRLQEVGHTVEGGSNYFLVAEPTEGLVGQVGIAPLALLTALFRPFLFEVANLMMLLNALETTALTVLFLRSIKRFRSTWRKTLRSPLMMFSLIFVLSMGIAVGLASTNLGTLSRYRVPMMPFFASLIILWDALSRQPNPGKQVAPPGLARSLRRSSA